MICPHCSTSVKFEWRDVGPINEGETNENESHFLIYDTCPNCDKNVVYYSLCTYKMTDFGYAQIEDVIGEKLIYPNMNKFEFIDYIPSKYLEDYEEALKVLSASPKASAALSRRLLQLILRDEYKVKKGSLSSEIDAFIKLPGIPSHITDAVDAIRNLGNLAAHPTKDKNTGEIVSVEPGEAEWLIDVIEALFDFSFVQPKKLEQRRNEINAKLKKIGKPEMKKKDESES